jgi:hypothetical protein
VFFISFSCNRIFRDSKFPPQALNSKGVKFATWDVKTHLLSLIIDENKT